jgi:signal transduction histidine kinase
VQDITAILELESTDGGNDIPPFAPVDLRALVLETCADFGVMVRDKGLNLDCSEIAPGDVTVTGATRYISQALDNLIRNAIKFTEKGTITVALWKDEDRRAKLSVSDTGIGIEADQLETIFKRFYQANGSDTRQYEGSGLGLSVVKDVMALHGGEVTVTSTVGEGSEFVLSFPQEV